MAPIQFCKENLQVMILVSKKKIFSWEYDLDLKPESRGRISGYIGSLDVLEQDSEA